MVCREIIGFLRSSEIYTVWVERGVFVLKPFKDEAQTALFKDPVRTAL